MLKFLSRTASISILTGAIALTFAIIVFLMAVVLAGEGPVMKTISCQLGLSKECVWVELQKERKALKVLRQENDALQSEVKKAEALFKRLSDLDHASESYVVFFESEARGYTVSTGYTYASLLDPETLVSAHCYIHAKVFGAGSRQIRIGKMDRNKRISLERYKASSLKGSGVSVSDIAAFQSACRWPNGAA